MDKKQTKPNKVICPNCKKELHEESSFCPFCMKKLVEEKQIKSIPIKKKNSLIVVIALSALVITILIGFFLFMNLNKRTKKTSNNFSINDHSSFVGDWVDENSANKTSIETQGGKKIKILSFDKENMVFDLELFTQAPVNRKAYIKNVHGKVKGNIVEFSFEDDGWENSGNGTFSLIGNKIEANIVLNNEKNDFSIAHKANYVKVKRTAPESAIDLEKLLGYFPEVRTKLGEETEKSHIDKTGQVEKHTFYNGIILDVDLRDNHATSIEVDYSKMEDKSIIGFRGINGTNDFSDAVNKFGAAEEYVKLGNEHYGIFSFSSEDKDGYMISYILKVQLDYNNKIIGFSYSQGTSW